MRNRLLLDKTLLSASHLFQAKRGWGGVVQRHDNIPTHSLELEGEIAFGIKKKKKKIKAVCSFPPQWSRSNFCVGNADTIFHKLMYSTFCEMFLTWEVRVIQRSRAWILEAVGSEFPSPFYPCGCLPQTWRCSPVKQRADERLPLPVVPSLWWDAVVQWFTKGPTHSHHFLRSHWEAVLTAGVWEGQPENLQPEPLCH